MIVEIQIRYCVDEFCQELGEVVQVFLFNDLEEFYCDFQIGVMKFRVVSFILQLYYFQQKLASES